MLRQQVIELDRFGRRIDPICYSEPLPIALDAMPDSPARAELYGTSDHGGGISKEHAAQLHDLAFKAGVPESDCEAFARTLAVLSGTDPTAKDQETSGGGGGGGKISRSRASKIWDMLKAKLSPGDLATATEMLKGLVDPNLSDEDEDETAQDQDHPPSFKGQPLRGGGMVGDAALRAFEREYPEIARIRKDDHYGVPCPMNPRREQRLALDARARAGGNSPAEESNPDLRAALASLSKIGRCY